MNPGPEQLRSTLGSVARRSNQLRPLSSYFEGGKGPPTMDVSNNSDAKKNLRHRCFGYFCFQI